MPAYNEADNLPVVIEEAAGVLDTLTTDWSILVVNDGSSDGTDKVLNELSAQQPRLQHIRLRRNFGKSEALRVGFSNVDADIVVLMDADGQDNPAELPRMIGVIDSGRDPFADVNQRLNAYGLTDCGAS